MDITSSHTQDAIKKAAKALFDGHLVAFPTETVYGLGADAKNEKAVGKIYSVKGRPTGHPVIVHISSSNQIDKWAVDVQYYARRLSETFWPGPLTLILSKAKDCGAYLTGGQGSIGIRVPSNPFAFELLSQFENMGGFGIAAPSANKFGSISPTSAEDVQIELGDKLDSKDLILNGGRCDIGIESTIIDCTKSKPKILRHGAITQFMIEDLLEIKLSSKNLLKKIKHSGSFESHYSPKAELILSNRASPGDGFIALASYSTPHGAIRLSSPLNVEEFAYSLYSSLRLCDIKGIKRVSVVTPEGTGLAVAIKDRLSRAAVKPK